MHIQYLWQGNHQIYGHIRCIYTVLANPTHSNHLPAEALSPLVYCAANEMNGGALVASGRGQVARLHTGGQQMAAAHNAAEYLQLVRSFKGLEAPVAGVLRKQSVLPSIRHL